MRRPAAAVLAVAALVLSALLATSSGASADTQTFPDPQTADSGAYFMQTDQLLVRNGDDKLVVVATGTYYWQFVDRLDLTLQTAGDARCWDLRSRTPNRYGAQRTVFFGNHCGDFHRKKCRGARIKASADHTRVRFVVPQRCIGKPAAVAGGVAFEDSGGLYNAATFGSVTRG